jgi:hypothetical protein
MWCLYWEEKGPGEHTASLPPASRMPCWTRDLF